MLLTDLDLNRAPDLLLGDIMAYVEAADASVSARDMVELSGLDKVVDMLCTRIVALDADAAQQHAPQLANLLQRITLLQKNMTTLQDEVLASIKSLNSTKKANQAYKNAPEG